MLGEHTFSVLERDGTVVDISFSQLLSFSPYILVYFYSKDSTSGCTIEALDFREHIKGFEALDVMVVGISRDTIASHKKFQSKHDLPFVLLSDPDAILHTKFAVLMPSKMPLKRPSVERSTFLLDTQGNILHEWRKVKPRGHVEKVYDFTHKIFSSLD